MESSVAEPGSVRRLLRVLIVEDSPADADLAVTLLKRAGIPLWFQVVDQPEALERALAAKPEPDLIICDHNLRAWTGFDALARLRKSGNDIPFIVITGTLGDEAAVEYIKQGAADYVLKHRLERLSVAVRQALREKTHRQEAARLHENILGAKREWELTFDSVLDPVLILNAQGTIQRANRAAADLSGKVFSEILGRPCWEVMPCRIEDPGACPHRQTVESGQRSRLEEFESAGDHWLECTANPRRDPDGNLKGSVIVVHDVTERRRSAEAVRQSEERFRKAFQAIPEPMSICRLADGVYLDVNNAFLKFYAFDRSEVVGHTPQEINTWANLDARREILAELACHRPARVRQLDFRTRSGEIRTVLLSAEGVDVGGEWCGLFVSMDITERLAAERELKKTQEQFLQAQKMEAVGRLAGGVAHDFNNLLTVINGYCNLLVEEAAPGSAPRRQLEEVLKAGEHAAALTRQLLAFSRKQVVVPTVLDLNAVVEGAQKMLRRLVGEDIRFVLNLARGLARVKADSGQVEQVIMNLVINARDAMPHGGTLTVETEGVELDEAYARAHADVAPGRYVLLALSDTGCGMDAETQAHIFEPFFTTKESGKGTGLGLSTVYGIVKQSGGHVSVYSELGHGTTFKVYFPCTRESPDEVSESAGAAARTCGGETVLLVEDEPAVRAMIQKALEKGGYTVYPAGGPEEALALWARHQAAIQMLVTDVIMPGMSGGELAGQLRRQRPGLRVLYLSGYTAEAIAQHGILPEGVAFLPKPFSPHELLAKLRRTLEA